MKTTTDIYQF